MIYLVLGVLVFMLLDSLACIVRYIAAGLLPIYTSNVLQPWPLRNKKQPFLRNNLPCYMWHISFGREQRSLENCHTPEMDRVYFLRIKKIFLPFSFSVFSAHSFSTAMCTYVYTYTYDYIILGRRKISEVYFLVLTQFMFSIFSTQ